MRILAAFALPRDTVNLVLSLPELLLLQTWGEGGASSSAAPRLPRPMQISICLPFVLAAARQTGVWRPHVGGNGAGP